MNFTKNCAICPYAEYDSSFEVFRCMDVSCEGESCYLSRDFKDVDLSIFEIPFEALIGGI